MKPLLRKIVRKLYTERIVFREPEVARNELPPTFVFGVHRSGTTLLRLMLDSHSRIAAPLESMFIMSLARLWEDPLSMKGLSGMGFPPEHVRKKLKEFIDYYFDAYTQAKGKARWVDKCPHYIDCMDFIEDVYGPDCRYIFLYRHGLDVACSVAEMPIEPAEPYKVACGDARVGGARYWAIQTEKMMGFQDKIGERGFPVYYEELVRDPEVILRGILQHVGEEWEDQILRFYEYDHCRAPGLEDPKASHSKKLTKSIGNWKNVESKTLQRMIEEADSVLKKLGYSTDSTDLYRPSS